MAPVIQEIHRHSDKMQSVVCVTAQHREMLDSVLDTFHICPQYDMDLMYPGQTLDMITANILIDLDKILKKEHPDFILVHGDTTTTFAAALSAFYHKIPFGHVEAGLRTYNLASPYPEEANRQMVSNLAELHFTPTMTALKNLLGEHKPADKIFVTGNTVIDALKTTVRENFSHPALEWADGKRIILLTAHRRENWGAALCRIFEAVGELTRRYEDIRVIYPCHPNPVVESMAQKVFGHNKSVRLTEPLEVIEFHNIMKRSYLVITDSGGIQEEAPSLDKPVLVVRDTTERPEGIKAGTLKLVGTEKENIIKETCRLLDSKDAYEKMSRADNPYGDGNASKRITEAILKYYKAL